MKKGPQMRAFRHRAKQTTSPRMTKGAFRRPAHKQAGLSSPSTCLALQLLVSQDPQSLKSPFREHTQYCAMIIF